jgi:hypothetical protein
MVEEVLADDRRQGRLVVGGKISSSTRLATVLMSLLPMTPPQEFRGRVSVAVQDIDASIILAND